jgi:hypothetical protein
VIAITFHLRAEWHREHSTNMLGDTMMQTAAPAAAEGHRAKGNSPGASPKLLRRKALEGLAAQLTARLMLKLRFPISRAPRTGKASRARQL